MVQAIWCHVVKISSSCHETLSKWLWNGDEPNWMYFSIRMKWPPLHLTANGPQEMKHLQSSWTDSASTKVMSKVRGHRTRRYPLVRDWWVCFFFWHIIWLDSELTRSSWHSMSLDFLVYWLIDIATSIVETGRRKWKLLFIQKCWLKEMVGFTLDLSSSCKSR